MSKQDVYKYFDQVFADEGTVEALREGDLAQIVKGARDSGFSFDEEDLRGAIQDLQASEQGGGELDDEELDGVAGGLQSVIRKVGD